MLNIQHEVFIFLFTDFITVYQKENGDCWRSLELDSDSNFVKRTHPTNVCKLLDDITARLHFEDELNKVKVQLVYNNSRDSDLCEMIDKLGALKCHYWQILNWQLIEQDLIKKHDEIEKLNPQFMEQYVLPFIDQWHSLNSSTQDHVVTYQDETSDEEKETMQQYIDELEGKVRSLQQVDLERIIAFAPVVFKNLWKEVGPDEFAYLLGSLQVPAIPSPYFPPTANCVAMKKKQFMALSQISKEQIINVCRTLQQYYPTLQIHLEFKSLIGEL